MELYNLMQNIRNINKEEVIKNSIIDTLNDLANLDRDRTCRIYSEHLKKHLEKNHISCRTINTSWFGSSYEHEFVLVPDNHPNYYVIDLTFVQFGISTFLFPKILEKGYQLMSPETFIGYMHIFCEKPELSLEDLYFYKNNSRK